MEAAGVEKLTPKIAGWDPDPDKGRVARNVIYAALEGASPEVLSQALGAESGATLVPLWKKGGTLNLDALDLGLVCNRVVALREAVNSGTCTASERMEAEILITIVHVLDPSWGRPW
jgi:hypothetical protein